MEDAVTTLLNIVVGHLENAKAPARVLYIDMSSAFNTLQPHLLFQKMISEFNLESDLALWVLDFLVGRHQQVRVNNTMSSVKVGSIPVQFYCLSPHIKSIEIACGISDVWAGSMYWLSSKWSEQIWYELYNCFAVFEPRSPGLVFMTHFLDMLKHNDVAAREEGCKYCFDNFSTKSFQ